MDSKIMDVLGDRVLELGPNAGESGPYRNFRLTHDGDGIAWLLFDRAGASANTLSADVIEEFELVLTALENQRPAGIVIRSAKAVRLHRRRRRQRIPRRVRSRRGRDHDRRKPMR